jgi:hypothetical protein
VQKTCLHDFGKALGNGKRRAREVGHARDPGSSSTFLVACAPGPAQSAYGSAGLGAGFALVCCILVQYNARRAMGIRQDFNILRDAAFWCDPFGGLKRPLLYH